jgi:nitroimidazol reductase NimA-like FMN-containing flavoprotein (pyridoxamine 5'-phosphate oxidase superfamily)
MDTLTWQPNSHAGNTFRELDSKRCLELLARSPIGRVAWCGPDGPQIVPVTISLHEGTIVFRTAAYSALARAADGSVFAVEVDDFDPFTRTGWSVVVAGPACAVGEPDELVELWRRDGPEPWAPGVRTLFVRITPRRVTGRQIARR